MKLRLIESMSSAPCHPPLMVVDDETGHAISITRNRYNDRRAFELQKRIAALPELIECAALLLNAEGAMLGTEYSNSLIREALSAARKALDKI